MRRRWLGVGALLAAPVLFAAGAALLVDPPSAAAQGPAMGDIQQVFAVGGVLTGDGTLWQFNLEKGVWVTIDEAFKEQGHSTNILPLPVAVSEIARMESFGFLVTRSGKCWLYDLENDRWRELGAPPKKR